MFIKILFLVASFFVADASDESDKPCLLAWDTAEALGGGALVGYAVGSHPHALAVRAAVAAVGAVAIKDSFDRDAAKPACKAVAAVGGAAVGFANAKTPAAPPPAAPVVPPVLPPGFGPN